MDAAQDDGDLMERLHHEMTRPPFHHWLMPRAVSVDAAEKTVLVALDYRPEFSHSPAEPIYHGGVIAALADITGHAAVAVWHGSSVPTVDLRIDYLRPAPAGTAQATGLLRKLGRSLAKADVEIRIGDRLVALGRGTFSTRREGT